MWDAVAKDGRHVRYWNLEPAKIRAGTLPRNPRPFMNRPTPPFASSLRAANNQQLDELKRASKWMEKAYQMAMNEFTNDQYGGPSMSEGHICAEYRVFVGQDWSPERNRLRYARLEARFLADGWNGAVVVQATENDRVYARLFALHEPVEVVVDGGTAFPLPVPVPSFFDKPEQLTLDEAIARIVKAGAWQYTLEGRTFIPPHRIIKVRHTFAAPAEP